MPSDYTIHGLGNPVQGNHPVPPSLPPLGPTQTGLAESTPSNDIIIGKGSATLAIQCTVKARLDVQPYTTNPVTGAEVAPVLAPGASGVVLQPDQVRLFTLGPGKYKLQTIVYV
jgi:hypothetical protein